MKMRSARLCALACLISCGVSAPTSAELIYATAAVGGATNLIQFDHQEPGNVLSAKFVTGLQPNEALLGIDVRPATRELYALGSTSRLYKLDPNTAAATPIGSPFAPLLNGINFGFDFNPMIDRIRVVSDVNQNLVLNPDTGAVQLVATDVNYAPPITGDPNVVHAAYSNNRPGMPSTQLYVLDAARGDLDAQANNTGVLTFVGNAGQVRFRGLGGFDISGVSGNGYVAIPQSSEPASSLAVIDFSMLNPFGVLNDVGVIGSGLTITGLTVALIPEPSTASLLVSALIGPMIFRRRR
jgi:hypothetical protein